ncbi:NnrU family protein [Ketobacter sp.]
MVLMHMGIVLWIGVHLIPSFAPGIKRRWKQALGQNGYMASFSMLLVLALVLIVMGWRTAIPGYIYALPITVNLIALLTMWLAAILFVSAKLPTHIKRVIRHPQLLGVVLWSVAHLLANGDTRSVTLFGSMLVWAGLQMYSINRRDGQWLRPNAPPLKADLILIVIGTVVYLALIYLHPYISGVPLTYMG